MIRSLDIRKGERWTSGRVPLHIVEATTGWLPRKPKRRRWLPIVLVAFALPSIAVASLLAAWKLLHWGLL